MCVCDEMVCFLISCIFAALLLFVNQVTSEKPELDVRAANSDQAVLNNMQIVLVGATMPRSIEEILGEVVPVGGRYSVFLALCVQRIFFCFLLALFCFTSQMS